MYHCHIHFYLTGQAHRVFEIVKGMSPLPHFTHEFFESDVPEEPLVAKADVILADVHGLDVRDALQTLTAGKREETELILLVDREQIALLTDYMPELADLWLMPMLDEEISFRFL